MNKTFPPKIPTFQELAQSDYYDMDVDFKIYNDFLNDLTPVERIHFQKSHDLFLQQGFKPKESLVNAIKGTQYLRERGFFNKK